MRAVRGSARCSTGVLRHRGRPLDELVEEPPAERGAADHAAAGHPVRRPRRSSLVVDDVHLADQDTVELLADLAGWSAAGALLVVATFRTDAGDAELVRCPMASDVGAQVVLRGLDRASLQRVCDMYAVAPWWPDDIDRLQELTGGVPLLVHELASEWARERAIRGVAAAADRSAAAQSRLAGLRAEITQSVEGIQLVLEQRRANVGPRHARAAVPTATAPGVPVQGTGRVRDGRRGRCSSGANVSSPSSSPGWPGRSCWPWSDRRAAASRRVVRAGLVPALVSGVLPVAGGWRTVVETPSAWRRDRHRARRRRSRRASAAGRRPVRGALRQRPRTTTSNRSTSSGSSPRPTDPDRCVVVVVRADQLDRCIDLEPSWVR